MNTVISDSAIEARMRFAAFEVGGRYREAKNIQETGVEARLKTGLSEYSSLVTKGDTAVESTLVAAIRRTFPDDSILGEEGTAGDAAPSGLTWVLDPIDGTENFSRGVNPWCVSAAVLRDGVPLASAIAVEGNVYATHVGLSGVLRNGEPMTATIERSGRKVISYECFDWFPDGLALIERLWETGYGTRQLNSSIGQSLYVDEGRLDGFLHPGLALWDHAGITLLAEKAGIKATRWDGTPSFPYVFETATRDLAAYRKNEYVFDLVVAIPELHERLLGVVADHAGWTERNRRLRRGRGCK